MVNLLAVLQVKAEGIQGVAILLVGQGEEVDQAVASVQLVDEGRFVLGDKEGLAAFQGVVF